MDFVRPIQAVIPGVQGRVLAVLAETTADLNLRTIARLSDVSLAQASRVLPSLVELGLVDRREVPPSSLFRLVREHVAAVTLLALARTRDAVIEEMGSAAVELHGHRSPSLRNTSTWRMRLPRRQRPELRRWGVDGLGAPGCSCWRSHPPSNPKSTKNRRSHSVHINASPPRIDKPYGCYGRLALRVRVNLSGARRQLLSHDRQKHHH